MAAVVGLRAHREHSQEKDEAQQEERPRRGEVASLAEAAADHHAGGEPDEEHTKERHSAHASGLPSYRTSAVEHGLASLLQ